MNYGNNTHSSAVINDFFTYSLSRLDLIIFFSWLHLYICTEECVHAHKINVLIKYQLTKSFLNITIVVNQLFLMQHTIYRFSLLKTMQFFFAQTHNLSISVSTNYVLHLNFSLRLKLTKLRFLAK